MTCTCTLTATLSCCHSSEEVRRLETALLLQRGLQPTLGQVCLLLHVPTYAYSPLRPALSR